MKPKHSKYKNTGILFELLTRQITSETISNSPPKSVGILRKFFGKKTTLLKEYQIYHALLNKKFDKDVFNSVGKVLELYAEDHPHFNTGITTEDTGYEHLIYIGAQGGEYKEHTDSDDFFPRVLTCSFILNDNYDGGDFVFFSGTYKIPPKAGSAVVFPSNFCFPHAVTPVTNGDRHAVITWIR